MPLTQQEKLFKSQQLLRRIYDNVLIAKDFTSDEDRVKHGFLTALREILGTSSDIEERLIRCIAPAIPARGKGVGACSNLASYFAWLYMCETRGLDISLVCTTQSGVLRSGEENHMFAIIGPINLGRTPFTDGECSRQVPKGITLKNFLGFQPEACIVVDPFYNFCFPLTDLEKKSEFISTCSQTPYPFHIDFFSQRADLLDRKALINYRIVSLSADAHDKQCLFYLNYYTEVLLGVERSNWNREGDSFTCVLPRSVSPKELLDLLRLGGYVKPNKIFKQLITVLGAEQVKYTLETPSAMNLYELISEARKLKSVLSAGSVTLP